MRIILTAALAAGMLTLSACSTHASSTAAFCAAVNKGSVEFAGLQDDPSNGQLVGKAARAMQHLADIAPSDIKSAMQAEASGYSEWAKTGNNAALTQNAFTVADDQLSTWLHLNCKHH